MPIKKQHKNQLQTHRALDQNKGSRTGLSTIDSEDLQGNNTDSSEPKNKREYVSFSQDFNS